MELRILKIIIILILIFFPTAVCAFDGEIYFGKYTGSHFRARPEGGVAQYISGMEIGHTIKILRPYAKIETIIDQYNPKGWFHPASVKYDLGIRLNLWKAYIEISHMCWHPIDAVGSIEQYNMFKIGARFGK